MVQPCPTIKPCAKGYPVSKLAMLFLGVFVYSFTAFAQAPAGAIEAVENSPYVRAWNDPSAWQGGVVPGAGDVAYIKNSVIIMTADVEVAAVIVEPFGYLYLYDVNDVASFTATNGSQYVGTGMGKTLTVTEYVKLTHGNGWKAGDNSTKGSTLVLNSTTAGAGGAANRTIRGTKTLTSWNVEVPSGATVDFNTGGDEIASTTILNKLSMKGGTVTGNAPTYGGASTLSYESAHTVGTEWTHSATTGRGVPQNVSVAASSSLNMGTSSNNYSLRGNLSADAASSALDLSGMDGNLTVEGNMSLGASGASTLTFTSTEGKGDLIVDGNLTIGASGTISGTQGDLKVGGNLAHSGTGGTFNYVEFNGASTQTISGTALTIDSLVVDNSDDDVTLADSDVTFSSNIDITAGGVFNPIDGSVDITGSTFTMNSDATGTARIATLANAAATSDVSGNITFERYIPSNADGPSWLAAGNYVVGATRADWTSSFGADFHLVFDWDETHVTDNTAGSNGANAWTIISNSSDVLHNDGIGYAVYTAAGSSPTLTATGTYHTSQQDLSLTFSNGASQGGGWHIVSNPFSSPIDGAEFLSDNSGVLSRYYMYDNANDIFETDLTGAPATIDVGQAFWVQVSSAGTVSFQLDQVTHGTNSFLRETDPFDHGMVGVRVAQSNGLFGHTFLRLHEEASIEWEWNLEATRRATANINSPEIFTTLENGHELLINAMNPSDFEGEIILPLTIETGSEGVVELQAEPGYHVPQGFCAYIEDTETGQRVGYSEDMAMVVELEPQSAYINRFVLVLMSSPEFEATASHCEGGVVHFIGEGAGIWDITWNDTSGELDGTGCATGLDAGDYIFQATNPLNDCRTTSLLSIDAVCMGDFNFNGERDITDLLILLVGIQPVENFEGTFPDTDCDCDGAMTTLDLLMFLPQFGNICH